MLKTIRNMLVLGVLGTVGLIGASSLNVSFNSASANPPPPELGPPTDPWADDSTCAVQSQYYNVTAYQYQGGLCNVEEVAQKQAAVNARLKYLQDKFGRRFNPSSDPRSEQFVDTFGIELGVPAPCVVGHQNAAGVFDGKPNPGCDPVATSYSGLYAGPGSEGSAFSAAQLSYNADSHSGNPATPRSPIISNPRDACYGLEAITCAAIRGGYVLESD